MATPARDLIWANFFHLGYNTYADRDDPDWFARTTNHDLGYRPYLRFDTKMWEDLTRRIAQAGGNAIVLSIGDGVRYDSHPEIAVEGAWTPAEMKAEIKRLKGLGIELIPKLNFSTGHDLWLGPYHRMISTPVYYEVCHDLIAELCQIFEGPRYFHLGYDEETQPHQFAYEYVTIRQHDLWWRDFQFFVNEVESAGSRPWIWSDYIWDHLDEFLTRMPRSVIQSNWYYWKNFDLNIDRIDAERQGLTLWQPQEGLVRTKTTRLRTYLELDRAGFDQVPTGSCDVCDDNFPDTVRWCREHISPEHLLGFMQTVWRPVLEDYRDRHELGLAKFAEGRAAWDEAAPIPTGARRKE